MKGGNRQDVGRLGHTLRSGSVQSADLEQPPFPREEMDGDHQGSQRRRRPNLKLRPPEVRRIGRKGPKPPGDGLFRLAVAVLGKLWGEEIEHYVANYRRPPASRS